MKEELNQKLKNMSNKELLEEFLDSHERQRDLFYRVDSVIWSQEAEDQATNYFNSVLAEIESRMGSSDDSDNNEKGNYLHHLKDLFELEVWYSSGYADIEGKLERCIGIRSDKDLVLCNSIYMLAGDIYYPDNKKVFDKDVADKMSLEEMKLRLRGQSFIEPLGIVTVYFGDYKIVSKKVTTNRTYLKIKREGI